NSCPQGMPVRLPNRGWSGPVERTPRLREAPLSPARRRPAGTRPAAGRGAPGSGQTTPARHRPPQRGERARSAPESRPALSCLAGNATADAARRSRAGREAQHERPASRLPLDQHFLDLGNRLGGVQILRADIGAVHDGVAAVQPEGILQLIQALAGGLIAAVDDPAVGREQRRGTQKALAVPPVARASGRAARAQNARTGPVDLLLLVLGLQTLSIRGWRRACLQPWLYGGVLRIEIGQVRHEVLHDAHGLKRIDTDIAPEVLQVRRARQAIHSVDVHRARAADALAARAAEGDGGVDAGFDLDQGIEHHRPAAADVELEGVEPRSLAGVRIEAIDAEGAHFARALASALRRLVGHAGADLGVLREKVPCHTVGPGLGRNGLYLI